MIWPAHKPAKAWGLFLIISLLVILLYQPWNRLATNTLAFLPNNHLRAHFDAIQALDANLANKANFLLCAEDWKEVKVGAALLHGKLDGSGLFSRVQGKISADKAQELQKFYASYQFSMPSQEVVKLLGSPDFKNQIILRQQTLLSSLQGDVRQLQQDPFLLQSGFPQREHLALGNFQIRDSWLMVQGANKQCIFLAATTAEDSFDSAYQSQFRVAYDAWNLDLNKQNPTLQLLTIAMVRFAEESKREAQQDMMAVSIVSICGVLILLRLFFASSRPILVGLIPLLSGVITGLLSCLLFYGEIHVIALALGATLTGVSIDYVFHYMVHWRFAFRKWDAKQPLGKVAPGIFFGLITSIIGYAGFFFAPIKGIEQTACFAVFGLLGSYFSIQFFFPHFFAKPADKRSTKHLQVAAAILSFWKKYAVLPSLVLIAALVAVLIITPVSVDDDIRKLSQLKAELKTEVIAFSKLAGLPDQSRSVLVTASSAEELLQRVERVRGQLERLQEKGLLAGYMTASQLIPSQEVQQKNHQELTGLLKKHRKSLQAYLSEMGFAQTDIQAYFKKIEAQAFTPLTLQGWLSSPISSSWQNMWWSGQSQWATNIYLESPFQSEDLQSIESPGVVFIDRVQEMSRSFGEHRSKVSLVLLVSYGVILYFLWVSFGLVQAFWVCFAPTVGAIAILSWLSITGQSFHLFHALSLIMVMGIGIDYSIFFWKSEKEDQPLVFLAVIASLITTLLSFGVLAFSSMPALMAIGQSIVVGLICSFLLAPLALPSYRTLLPKAIAPIRLLDVNFRLLNNTLISAIGFIFFGLGGVVISYGFLPLIKLLSLDPVKGMERSQWIIHWVYRLYYLFLNCFGFIETKVEGLENLKAVEDEKIVIIANHPTLLDYVFIASVVPKLTCLIKQEVWDNPFMSKMVKTLGYIPFHNPMDTIALAQERLKQGFPLLIFPEGTRSPINGIHPFNKGSAFIAISSECLVLPVQISMSEPILMKGWKWWKVSANKSIFKLKFYPPISTLDYLRENKDMQGRASKALNQDLEKFYRASILSSTEEVSNKEETNQIVGEV